MRKTFGESLLTESITGEFEISELPSPEVILAQDNIIYAILSVCVCVCVCAHVHIELVLLTFHYKGISNY